MADTHAKYLLIGGGLASATAAKEIRARDETGSIVIVGAESRQPYNRPPLTKEYLVGDAGADVVPLQSVGWYADNRVSLLTGTRATATDPSRKTMTLADGSRIEYEKLLIATGAEPIVPDIAGARNSNVQTMRTWDDSDALKPYLSRSLVIVGGGYIGVEVAAASIPRGGQPIVIERSERLWRKTVSEQFSGWLASKLRDGGAELVFNDSVTEVIPEGVRTKNGRAFAADRVLLASGVAPRIELAKDAGLSIDAKTGGVETNAYLETSVPDIWAAGDIASFHDPVLGKRWRLEHYNNAQWHGEVAGANMAGDRVPYDHVANFWSDEFGFHLELFGDPEAGAGGLFHGDPASGRFDELYVDDRGRVVMVISINPTDDLFPTLETLPRKRPSIRGREADVRRTDFDLGSLL